MTRLAIATSLAAAALLTLSATACAESETTTANVEETQAAAETQANETEAQPAQTPAEAALSEPSAADMVVTAAPDSDWRTVEAQNLIKIATTDGDIWVELAPEFAPIHVDRMRELARSGWFEYKVWHRVIDDFMAQGGGALDNPNITAPTAPIEAEFQIRRDPNAVIISEIAERQVNPRSNRTRSPAGFFNGMQAGTQPAAAAAIMGDGRVDSWLIHCPGAAAMARTSDPNSANAQFYIVRGDALHLNTQYTVWGKVRVGQDVVNGLEVGTLGQGFGFSPDFIEAVEVASDLDDAPTVQVMDTNSASFAAYLDALRDDAGALPDLCDIEAPVRVSN